MDNELKIIDLCGRLPYGVFCLVPDHDNKMIRVSSIEVNTGTVVLLGDIYPAYYDDWLAYLRPMDSMTDKEGAEYSELQSKLLDCMDADIDYSPYSDVMSQHIDWLNANHFDYRGLIEKGLALEAPEGMYKND